MDTAFQALKSALSTAPALGLPDYAKVFHLYCRESGRSSGTGSRWGNATSTEATQPFKVGDLVPVRALHRHGTLEPPYGPPTTVIAITRTAILCDSSPLWIHTSRIKHAPPPLISSPIQTSLQPPDHHAQDCIGSPPATHVVPPSVHLWNC